MRASLVDAPSSPLHGRRRLSRFPFSSLPSHRLFHDPHLPPELSNQRRNRRIGCLPGCDALGNVLGLCLADILGFSPTLLTPVATPIGAVQFATGASTAELSASDELRLKAATQLVLMQKV